MDGYSDKVSGDHVTRAPTPRGHPESASVVPWPQGRVVPLDHEELSLEFFWEAFVDNSRDEEDLLYVKVRWWGYSPEEDTWKSSETLDSRTLSQYCRRVATRQPPSDAEAAGIWGAPPPGGN